MTRGVPMSWSRVQWSAWGGFSSATWDRPRRWVTATPAWCPSHMYLSVITHLHNFCGFTINTWHASVTWPPCSFYYFFTRKIYPVQVEKLCSSSVSNSVDCAVVVILSQHLGTLGRHESHHQFSTVFTLWQAVLGWVLILPPNLVHVAHVLHVGQLVGLQVHSDMAGCCLHPPLCRWNGSSTVSPGTMHCMPGSTTWQAIMWLMMRAGGTSR